MTTNGTRLESSDLGLTFITLPHPCYQPSGVDSQSASHYSPSYVDQTRYAIEMIETLIQLIDKSFGLNKTQNERMAIVAKGTILEVEQQ